MSDTAEDDAEFPSEDEKTTEVVRIETENEEKTEDVEPFDVNTVPGDSDLELLANEYKLVDRIYNQSYNI